MPKEVITPAGLATLALRHCHDWGWGNVPVYAANPEADDDEGGPISCSAVAADRLNALLAAVKAAGGPAPACVYFYCDDHPFIEWMADSDRGFPRVVADHSPGYGWMVMESVPPAGAVFYEPEGFP